MTTKLTELDDGCHTALRLAVEDLLRDRPRLLGLSRPLGSGATAEVHSCAISGSPVALKVARADCDGVLLREAEVLALFGGGAAPALLGSATSSPCILAMELIPGQPLSQLEKTLEPEQRRALALRVLSELAGLLCRVHGLGWAHHDVKPENILVSDERVVLIDWGLASDQPFVEAGTPLFLPPRVLHGEAVSGSVADAYALCRTVAGIFDPRWLSESAPAEPYRAIPEDFRAVLQPILEADGASWAHCQRVLGDATLRGLVHHERGLRAELRAQYLSARYAELRLQATFSLEKQDSARADEERTTLAVPRPLLSGLPLLWMQEVALRLRQLHERPGDRAAMDRVGVSWRELSAHDRRRFLGRIIGPQATSWQLPATTDAALLAALEELGRSLSLRQLSYAQLRGALTKTAYGDEDSAGEPCDLALALAQRPVGRAVLQAVLALSEPPVALAVEAGRAARLQGDYPLAEAILRRVHAADAELERALTVQRWGAREQAVAMFETVAQQGHSLASCRARASLARVLFDKGDLAGAKRRLADGGPALSAAYFEVLALIELYSGEDDACLRAIEEGLALASHDEQRARLWAIAGMRLHSAGDAKEALERFRLAAESAERQGAVLEEATYLTGVAAAACDAGLLHDAELASERAEQLFESLDLPAMNARVLLSRAAVLSALGAEVELRRVVLRGSELARRAQDTRCEAYLLLSLADVVAPGEESVQLAQRADELLGSGSREDRLHCAARLLDARLPCSEQAGEWLAQSGSPEAQLSYLRARAEQWQRSSASKAPGAEGLAALEQLAQLARSERHPLALGPALVAGGQLALALGRGEQARHFFAQAEQIAARLLQALEPADRPLLEKRPWVLRARGSRIEPGSGALQLGDVEGLLRALGHRGGFRALLNQVLDMLLLWTGVERGLLLLRAPGERLVVRAARNLQREDLSGEQRQLSYTMAQRALREGRAVVAVDAATDESQLGRSVVALHLRSVLAVPLAARGQVLGVAYLDDRVRRGAFGERELAWANLISTVAALAICDEKDRIELRRAMRKAQRAEGRLQDNLSEKERELELAERELSRLGGEDALRGNYDNIIGRGRAMRQLLSLVDRVAQSEVPALVVGESGTGKELIARAIATQGSRKKRPFVAENCGAVPETLLESILFGHQKGAFTGATRNQAGLFSVADGGTLFLDEIGEMPLSMQTKLLRVLQDGEIRPLGSERSQRVDVRLIVATHRDLAAMVAAGSFREDLYYRLNVVRLQVPALRERPEDIPLLVRYFLQQHGQADRELSEAAMQRLTAYAWPGNVRQLENEVRRMLVLGGTKLSLADLSPEIVQSTPAQVSQPHTLREKVDALERELVSDALERTAGNRTRAAELLGISRYGLQKMCVRLQIDEPSQASKSGRI